MLALCQCRAFLHTTPAQGEQAVEPENPKIRNYWRCRCLPCLSEAIFGRRRVDEHKAGLSLPASGIDNERV